MVTVWCEYTHQVSLGSQQQTDESDNYTALLDPVESSQPACDDENGQ